MCIIFIEEKYLKLTNNFLRQKIDKFEIRVRVFSVVLILFNCVKTFDSIITRNVYIESRVFLKKCREFVYIRRMIKRTLKILKLKK